MARSSSTPASHDCGPWIEAPNSSRLTRYRYDYGMGELQVEWRNRRGDVHTTYKLAEGSAHVTGGIEFDPATGAQIVTGAERDTASRGATTYRKFAIAVSKGKYVNSTLNGFEYWKSTPEELAAPSNPNRRAVQTREKGAGVDFNYDPTNY